MIWTKEFATAMNGLSSRSRLNDSGRPEKTAVRSAQGAAFDSVADGHGHHLALLIHDNITLSVQS